MACRATHAAPLELRAPRCELVLAAAAPARRRADDRPAARRPAPSQESELTPTGANLLDGRYAVFGYVTQGSELLKEMQARHAGGRPSLDAAGCVPATAVWTHGQRVLPARFWPWQRPDADSGTCSRLFRGCRWATRLRAPRSWLARRTLCCPSEWTAPRAPLPTPLARALILGEEQTPAIPATFLRHLKRRPASSCGNRPLAGPPASGIMPAIFIPPPPLPLPP